MGYLPKLSARTNNSQPTLFKTESQLINILIEKNMGRLLFGRADNFGMQPVLRAGYNLEHCRCHGR